VLKIEAVFLLVPSITSLIYQEQEGRYYLLIAALCLFLGVLMTYRKPSSTVFYLKEGCLATSLSWIVLSFFGALPFWMSGEIPRFEDALFETVSGFTTTGASILSNVEALSHCALLWRSFTHWIGGMGVLVFLLAILPLSGGSSINLMRAESPGPSVGKLVPKVRYTAAILYAIYFAMTVLELIFLLIGKMPLFDALATSLGTAGTGGFGIKNDSVMSYSPYIQWVIAIFMMLFGVNFNAYFFLLYRHFRKAFGMEEVHYYLGIILVSVLIIFNNIRSLYETGFEALTHAFFQVCTLATSTGFASADFDQWPKTSQTVLVLLMFVGACAGSTGGGIKVSRIMILFKTVLKELNSYIHPKSVKKINMERKPVEHDVVRSTNVYFVTFMIIFSISILAISLEGKDLVTNFTAVIATLNNMGPGLALVGPTQNFGHFNVFSKVVLMFDMLAGRLELFPVLILFHPAIWSGLRDSLQKKK
jgi:trk system potassium uptake protein TrkH